MDELDDLLRDTFRSRGDGALDATGLAAAARSGHARHLVKRRQLLAVGAVGVLAAGGSSALALGRHGSGGRPGVETVSRVNSSGQSHSQSQSQSQSPSQSPSPASGQGGSATVPPKPGTRPWSSHGLQVYVPEAWKANQTDCGTPIADTVVIGGGAVPMCLLGNPPAVDVVAFDSATVLDPKPLPALHPTTISGHAAQTGTEQVSDGRTVTVVIVPDLDVSVTVKSKDKALVARIVGTAQIVKTDANGCASEAATVAPTGTPARPGAQTTMVPGTPVKAVVCHYSVPMSPTATTFAGPTFLANGSTIAPDQIGKLTDILNTLKPGQAAWDGLAGYCPSAAHDGYLFRFTYASGQPVDVYLHTSDCDHNGFDNGAVTGYLSQRFVDGVQAFLPAMGFQAEESATR